MKMAAKTSSLDNNSPYRQMANNMSNAQKQMAKNSMHPSEVANVILRAVTSDNADFRYTVGKGRSHVSGSKKKYVRRGIYGFDKETTSLVILK